MMKQTMTMTAVSVMLASLALAGCGRRDDAHVAQNDTAVVQGRPSAAEQAEQSARNAGDATAQAARDAAEATRQAAAEAKDATKGAADQASNKVADALITTSVNAELAKDPKLSSLRINVDTEGGRVALRGSAPDMASKERAAQLASAVKGVVSVDNQLTVEKQG
ncbi:BON domain-containing protein [Piscinibacter sp. XHJ-5]|uniref:BON domain-containing protein n=1 Tax=Piscinibacter sp. XHJ-5 TaxID=3037797 RepID=UPI0024532BBC|nr:BON domain-containing protein [Piscinibacter sp. XHJ-5]